MELEHLSYKERLRELGMVRQGKTRLPMRWEEMKERGPRLFLVVPSDRQEVMGQTDSPHSK